VQRCLDAAAGTGVDVAIIPAGTANLLATNLDLPTDLAGAVDIAVHGRRARLDLGRINGEHFAVMAGAGLDAEMIDDAGRTLKNRLGQAAYVWTALRHVRDPAIPVKLKVDGKPWFTGPAACVLFANVSRITGGIRAFPEAVPDDGWLEIGVATAEGMVQWARTAGRLLTGHPERSALVHTTRACRRVKVRFAAPMRYELDGGDRRRVTRLKVDVVPAAVTIRVPRRDLAG
jgi:diacylglycerol kinase family enzyme